MICNLFKKKQVERNRDIEDDPNSAKVEEAGNLWIPWAENISKTENIRMRTRGEYVGGYPEGLVVHFTAGWHLKKGLWMNPFPNPTPITPELERVARDYAMRTAKMGAKNGHNYLVMSAIGRLYQSRDLSKHGYHAGKSKWKGNSSVSRYFHGVEMLCLGELEKKGDKYFTWFNYEVPSQHVGKTKDKQGRTRYFHRYSIEQEHQLVRLCVWLWRNSPRDSYRNKIFDINNIVGHHEVSPGRKSDPMGSLSMGMDGLREKIFKEIKR